jgi:hypothetical protein
MVVHSVGNRGSGISKHGMLLSLDVSPFLDGLIGHMVRKLVFQFSFNFVPNFKDLGSWLT